MDNSELAMGIPQPRRGPTAAVERVTEQIVTYELKRAAEETARRQRVDDRPTSFTAAAASDKRKSDLRSRMPLSDNDIRLELDELRRHLELVIDNLDARERVRRGEDVILSRGSLDPVPTYEPPSEEALAAMESANHKMQEWISKTRAILPRQETVVDG